jgi:hypothetical protein
MSGFEIINTDWSRELERDFQEYIFACEESIDEEEHFVTLSEEYFCGCSVCYTREQLFFLTPRIIEGYEKGFIKLTKEKELG